MTPDETTKDVAARNKVILKIAKACKNQGSFHIAAKKYAQAGERTRAIKALIKSGDNNKIISFACAYATVDHFECMNGWIKCNTSAM